MNPTDLPAHYRTQAALPTWQHELRQSVRLRLALTEPGLDAPALHAAQCLVEHELRRQLLASDPASAALPEAATLVAEVVRQQQLALLGERTAHEALRRELPVTEFAVTLRRTCRPAHWSAGGTPASGCVVR